MPRRKKSRQEIASQFFVNVAEIGRLFGIGRVMAERCFDKAKEIDTREIDTSCFVSSVVRLTSVLKALGISQEELKDKLKADTEE